MDDDLSWLPAWQLRELIEKRQVSPVEITEHFLARVERLNPLLRGFSYVDADGARQTARRAEAAVIAGDVLGPLHGVPVGVKEMTAVAGFPIATPVPPGTDRPDAYSARDDLPVERLRAAGAVILGHNSAEGTGGGQRFPIPHFNWDAEARNPWNTERVPGWSSSGGAASVAAGLVPLALGGDGGGSTRLPAAYCGVVGVHTSPGLVPTVNYDTPSLASLLGSVGPLCRDVTDAALMLQAIAGPDGRDYCCSHSDPPDFARDLHADVSGLRLAWTDDLGFAATYAQQESPRVVAAAREAAGRLSSLGATVDPVGTVWQDFWPAFQAAFPVAMMPGLALVPPPSPADWQHSLEVRQANWQTFRELFSQYDLLLCPTSQLLPWTVQKWDAAWTVDSPNFPGGSFAPVYTSHTMMFNFLGIPAMTVPCGFVDGLPVGLQIAGRRGSEPRILQLGHAFVTAFESKIRPPASLTG